MSAGPVDPQAENARLLAKSSVAVAPESGARRGHRGCVCSLGERRDRDQRDQRESSDEFPHDTSPCYGTIVSCNNSGESPCVAVIGKMGLGMNRIIIFLDSLDNQIR
jgi:hypothetical protein